MSLRSTCTVALALALVLPTLPVAAQAPAASAPPFAVATPLPEASGETDLVAALSKELGVTASQAAGAAGALFGLARTRLKPEEFASVAAVVPDMEKLLEAAPVADPRAAAAASLAPVAGAANLGGLSAVAGSFTKLGLKPALALKAVPVLTGFVRRGGGGEAASLLAGVLK